MSHQWVGLGWFGPRGVRVRVQDLVSAVWVLVKVYLRVAELVARSRGWSVRVQPSVVRQVTKGDASRARLKGSQILALMRRSRSMAS